MNSLHKEKEKMGKALERARYLQEESKKEAEMVKEQLLQAKQ